MHLNRIVFTGEAGFLYRYRFLMDSIAQRVEQVETIATEKPANPTLFRPLLQSSERLAYNLSARLGERLFYKTKRSFIATSRHTERRLRQLPYTPDLVIQIFAISCPIWDHYDIPYAMYLDYTTALTIKNWSRWAPFVTERRAWLDCERRAFANAAHLFVMSQLVKTSLINDYGIDANKITVTGVAANFEQLYEGEKTFGSKQILFNGSDFLRKGGELVLAAFKIVKATIPAAQLVIIGKDMAIDQPGVIVKGNVKSRDQLKQLFLTSDLVLAPSYCDPFPTFLLEAFNHGVPCVVPNRDGMPEIVSDGIDGRVVQEMDGGAIAAVLIELLQDDRLTGMSQAARQKIRDKFNWDDIGNLMVDTFKAIP